MKQKKLLFIALIALSFNNQLFAQSEQLITLDLSRPVNPTSFTFDTEKGQWTESFSNAPLVFEHFTFDHSGSSDYGGYWSGFTISISGDSTDHGSKNSTDPSGWLPYQWGNMAGGGIKTGADGAVLKDENGKVIAEKGIPYLVGYGDSQIVFDAACKVVGTYLSTHPYAYYDISYGGDYDRALNQEGDYFKAIFHGLDAEGVEIGTVEYIFAEYKNGGLIQSRDWEWVDLSALGTVKSLSLTFESTDISQYGADIYLNTPAYFCLDKLQALSKDTGIKIVQQTTARVYPNPASEWLTIESQTKIGQVSVSDISGKTIYQSKNTDDSKLNINVSTWAKGVYIVKWVNGSEVFTQKIIKK
jgi:hypothetical protein